MSMGNLLQLPERVRSVPPTLTGCAIQPGKLQMPRRPANTDIGDGGTLSAKRTGSQTRADSFVRRIESIGRGMFLTVGIVGLVVWVVVFVLGSLGVGQDPNAGGQDRERLRRSLAGVPRGSGRASVLALGDSPAHRQPLLHGPDDRSIV